MQVQLHKKTKSLLRAWLELQNISVYRFAKLLKITYPAASNILNKLSVPKLDTAIKIEELTKGAVPCMSWKADLAPKDKVKNTKTNKPYNSKSHDAKKHTNTISKGSR